MTAIETTAFQQDEDRDARLHRLILVFNNSNEYRRERVLAEIWQRYGDYFERCIFKHANKMGGTERGFRQHEVYEYRTGGDQNGDVSGYEGVMDETMAATSLRIRKADDREGMLEAELRSAAYLLFLKAAKKFDPARGVPFMGYYWKIARHAVIDVKRRRPAGLTGKPEHHEPKATGPCQYEQHAVAMAERILGARSMAYVQRWCERSDVDVIDGDIIRLHLFRSDDKSVPFHSLEDIAARYGISKQAIAKRRKQIVTDLLGKGSKRGSDGMTPTEHMFIWLSVSEDVRICLVGEEQQTPQTTRLSVSGEARNCFEGGGSLHLIDAHQSALEEFAAGTRFNLFWREMPEIHGLVDTSVERLAAIAGTEASVYEMLSTRGRRALRQMRHIHGMLGKPRVKRPSFYQSTNSKHLGQRPHLVPGPILEFRAYMRKKYGPCAMNIQDPVAPWP
jgi:hypothetical protein